MRNADVENWFENVLLTKNLGLKRSKQSFFLKSIKYAKILIFFFGRQLFLPELTKTEVPLYIITNSNTIFFFNIDMR